MSVLYGKHHSLLVLTFNVGMQHDLWQVLQDSPTWLHQHRLCAYHKLHLNLIVYHQFRPPTENSKATTTHTISHPFNETVCAKFPATILAFLCKLQGVQITPSTPGHRINVHHGYHVVILQQNTSDYRYKKILKRCEIAPEIYLACFLNKNSNVL